jgi:hypothetical protein
MSQSIGTAKHRYPDGSVSELRVEISPKGAQGFPARVGEPDYFNRRRLNPNEQVPICGARQARVLANWLMLLADRLEARGEM